MLGKLLKYDLKYMIKNMSVFYILAFVFAILTRVFFAVEDSLIFNIIAQICNGTMISMICSIMINTMLRSWIRFRDSIYKDESYLTHTLPVTKNAIYDSQFIQSLLFFVVGFIVIIACLFIAYYTEAKWTLLKEFVSTSIAGLNVSFTTFIILMLVIIFLEIYNAIQCGFFGMILGHRQNNSKILLSICFGFIAYMFVQSAILGMMFIVALFDEGLMQMFTSNILSNVESFKLLVLLTIVFYTVVILLMRFICKKLFNKGVDVE